MLRSISTTIVLFLSCALAQNECYYAADKRAGSAIIPCGASGTQSSCCQIGDLCLSDSACWNPTYNITYLYGCTDSTYQDPTCPWKCGPSFADAPYVGLDYCYNTTQNEWSCTHPPDNSESIQAFQAQQCYDDSIIAFAGPSSLQPILSLPTNVGGSTVWFSQVNPTSYLLDSSYTPTTTSIQVTASVPTTVEIVSATATSVAGVATSSASTTSGPSGPSGTSAGQSTSAESSSSGLSSGAKIGIGVGVGVGVLGLIALGSALFFSLRRRSHEPVPQTDDGAGAYASDVKNTRPPAPTELPGATPGTFTYDHGGYSGGYGGSSTGSNWDSPAPTYQSYEPAVPRPAGHDRLHEMG